MLPVDHPLHSRIAQRQATGAVGPYADYLEEQRKKQAKLEQNTEKIWQKKGRNAAISHYDRNQTLHNREDALACEVFGHGDGPAPGAGILSADRRGHIGAHQQRKRDKEFANLTVNSGGNSLHGDRRARGPPQESTVERLGRMQRLQKRINALRVGMGLRPRDGLLVSGRGASGGRGAEAQLARNLCVWLTFVISLVFVTVGGVFLGSGSTPGQSCCGPKWESWRHPHPQRSDYTAKEVENMGTENSDDFDPSATAEVQLELKLRELELKKFLLIQCKRKEGELNIWNKAFWYGTQGHQRGARSYFEPSARVEYGSCWEYNKTGLGFLIPGLLGFWACLFLLCGCTLRACCGPHCGVGSLCTGEGLDTYEEPSCNDVGCCGWCCWMMCHGHYARRRQLNRRNCNPDGGNMEHIIQAEKYKQKHGRIAGATGVELGPGRRNMGAIADRELGNLDRAWNAHEEWMFAPRPIPRETWHAGMCQEHCGGNAVHFDEGTFKAGDGYAGQWSARNTTQGVPATIPGEWGQPRGQKQNALAAVQSFPAAGQRRLSSRQQYSAAISIQQPEDTLPNHDSRRTVVSVPQVYGTGTSWRQSGAIGRGGNASAVSGGEEDFQRLSFAAVPAPLPIMVAEDGSHSQAVPDGTAAHKPSRQFARLVESLPNVQRKAQSLEQTPAARSQVEERGTMTQESTQANPGRLTLPL